MDNYFEKAKIDNPLNIKRLTGDMPTTKSSSKNVMLLLVVFSITGLTIANAWQIALMYLKSPVLTTIVIGLLYGSVILKTFSITIFEEKKQKKAYQDLLDNKISDLSVIWEIQDIKEEEVQGDKIAYIDYINGTRTVLLRCVPGSVLNRGPEAPKYHYNALERLFKEIDDLGYGHDIYVKEEASRDDEALNFYYDSLKNVTDPEFIDIFTEQLDTIAYVNELTSAIHVLYIEISGIGKYKHNMLRNITALPEVLSANTIYKSVGFVETKAELDKWIAEENSVAMFDREELIMNKYKNTFNLGVTAVLGAFDRGGNLLRRFNNDFDIKKMVRKKSIDLNSGGREEPAKVMTPTSPSNAKPVRKPNNNEVRIDDLTDSKHKKYIELLYAKDKVKLGG